MSKTAREAIADFLTVMEFPKTFTADHASGLIIEALAAAGFVIVPKESTEEIIQRPRP